MSQKRDKRDKRQGKQTGDELNIKKRRVSFAVEKTLSPDNETDYLNQRNKIREKIERLQNLGKSAIDGNRSEVRESNVNRTTRKRKSTFGAHSPKDSEDVLTTSSQSKPDFETKICSPISTRDISHLVGPSKVPLSASKRSGNSTFINRLDTQQNDDKLSDEESMNESQSDSESEANAEKESNTSESEDTPASQTDKAFDLAKSWGAPVSVLDKIRSKIFVYYCSVQGQQSNHLIFYRV
jgi:hypothetical protein